MTCFCKAGDLYVGRGYNRVRCSGSLLTVALANGSTQAALQPCRRVFDLLIKLSHKLLLIIGNG